MIDKIRITNYLKDNARLVLDGLGAPVNMLVLQTFVFDDISGDQVHGVNVGDELVASHFQYGIGIQSQSDRHDSASQGGSHFELKFTLEDFRTLHSFLMKVKTHHQNFLVGASQNSITIIAQDASRLCFDTQYLITKRSLPVIGDVLMPVCREVRVYIWIGMQKTEIGTFNLNSDIEGLTGLILEADRLQAILNGAGQEDVSTIQRLATGIHSSELQ